MARRNEIEEEEYELSVCAEDAVSFYWPDSLRAGTVMFERRMIELQLALIECKMMVMFPSDKRRAKKTIAYLKEKVAKL
jgi:hypothetical protein